MGTDWQRNAVQGTDWQSVPMSPAQSKARVDARRKNKFLDISAIVDRANRKRRGKGRIGVAANRDKINKGIAVARPSGASSTAGATVSPLTEQYYDGAQGYYSMTSSDGLFVFEYPTQTAYIDGGGTDLIVIHIDPDAPPPP